MVLKVIFLISESDYTFGYAIVSDLVYSMLTHGHMAPGPLGESYESFSYSKKISENIPMFVYVFEKVCVW